MRHITIHRKSNAGKNAPYINLRMSDYNGCELGLQQSLNSLLFFLSSLIMSPNEPIYKDIFSKEGLFEPFPPSYLLSLITLNYIQ